MEQEKKFWERTAKLYGPIQERSNRRLYDAISACCAPYISSHTRVLELACGSGQLTLPLAPLAADWEATDFSPNMIAEAEKRQIPAAHFSVQDAVSLPYQDGEFHVVLMANALHIMPEPERACAEIRRVLRPGGVLLAPTFVYEGKVNRLRMALTTMLGFRTYHQWDAAGLLDFLTGAGFTLLEQKLLPGDPLPALFAAVQK